MPQDRTPNPRRVAVAAFLGAMAPALFVGLVFDTPLVRATTVGFLFGMGGALAFYLYYQKT